MSVTESCVGLIAVPCRNDEGCIWRFFFDPLHIFLTCNFQYLHFQPPLKKRLQTKMPTFNCVCYLRQGGYVFVGLCLFVCLSVCEQDNSKSYGRIFLKFWGYVGHGINYRWLNFRSDPAGILDSGSLWNFRYHCVKGGIREPLAKRRWWRHLANSFALAEVPAGYDCYLVVSEMTVAQASWFRVSMGNMAKPQCPPRPGHHLPL